VLRGDAQIHVVHLVGAPERVRLDEEFAATRCGLIVDAAPVEPGSSNVGDHRERGSLGTILPPERTTTRFPARFSRKSM
jgi:hypothetical protein